MPDKEAATIASTDATNPQALRRPSVTAIDEILGRPFKVLDGGFVRVIDYMGDDASIVQAARVSYGIGTKRLQDDRGLIRYLLRNAHSTPFEMCEIKLHVRVPMDAWRQWVRHRTASVNEYSTRYSLAIDMAQRTGAHEWRLQSPSNKQGSKGSVDLDAGAHLSARESTLLEFSREIYRERIDKGVAREQARKDLPLSTYTEAYWKIDLHNLLHFLKLRTDSHAQAEIRSYATIIEEQILARWVPFVWEAFLDYRKNSLLLSDLDVQVVSALAKGDQQLATKIASDAGILTSATEGEYLPNRERAELDAKLVKLGLTPPWTA